LRHVFSTFRSKSLQFSPLSPQEIVNLSEFESIFRELYQIGPDGVKAPQKDGVLDARLVGVVDPRFCVDEDAWKLTSCRRHPTHLRERP
jgi:hypothetical protein